MSIDSAYATCAAITRRKAKNFSYGIRLLPPTKRRALSAVYALARRIDDIGDGALPTVTKKERLAETRDDVHRLAEYRGGRNPRADDPVLTALSHAAGTLPIPIDAFDELIDGCEADVQGRRYDTFDELIDYCRCVAGSIGRLSVGVYDPANMDRARPLADTLGLALQLTNILRDVCEDRHDGRVYLPSEDLDRFGVAFELDDYGALTVPPDRFAALFRYEAARAERLYSEGLGLLPLLDHRSAACTAAMAGIYRRLLAKMAADPEPVRRTRLSLSTTGKLRVAGRAIVWGRT